MHTNLSTTPQQRRWSTRLGAVVLSIALLFGAAVGCSSDASDSETEEPVGS